MVVLMLSSKSISVECILNVIFKVRKVDMDLCDIWTNISDTVHAMTNDFMKDIYKVIYDLSVCIMTFDLSWHLKVKFRSHNFQDVYLTNDESFDQSLHEWNP